MINYDIHWNPVRLMQRIGRVDRRMNPEVEKRLVADHPEVAIVRGKVSFWNFLPPDELNAILTLYTRVSQKTLLISKTLGIEGKKLLKPEDDYEALREFNHAYEGTKSVVEEMHLEYQDLITSDTGLEDRLERLPGPPSAAGNDQRRACGACSSAITARTRQGEGMRSRRTAGTARWYLVDLDRDAILEEPQEILASIRSKPDTPRVCTTAQPTLSEIRVRIEKHIKNTYLKRVDAPVGVRPSLKCWMELNEG